MLKHEDVWRALDTLAAEKGLSPSGLARAAGLDPTTFNPSKRTTRAGLRWPSTESLSRVLTATGATLESFTALVGGARALTMSRHGHRAAAARHLPLLPLSRLSEAGLFDGSGYPVGAAWEQTEVPQPADPHSYAVRVDSPRFEPVFREGGTLILSPEAPIRPHDRVLLCHDAQIDAVVITRRDRGRLLFRPLDAPAANDAESRDNVAWMHRIVWTSL